jgi:hypothetical protein
MTENYGSMTAEDRARIVLEYMANHQVAMSPGLWHANLKMDRTVTFSQDTTRRRIHDFLAKGWVEKHDIDQGVFQITEDGQAAVDDLSDDELRDIIGLSGE